MKKIILYIYNIIKLFIPETHFFSFKRFILRLAGLKIENNVRICSSATFSGSGEIFLGENTWIGPSCLIISNYPSKIVIGKNVDIAPKVYIGNGSHVIDMNGKHSAGTALTKDIVIHDGVWVCTNSTILLGVTIGTNAVIGAGSVVNKDVESKVIAGGIPCKLIKDYKLI